MTRPDEPDELDDTVLVRRGRHAPATEARVADDTVLVRRPGAPQAVPEDDTVVRVRPVPRVAVTGSAPPSPGAPPAPVARVHLLRVGSAAHRLDAPVVVGRRPSAPRVSTGAPAVLVAVPSPTSEVSSSHVRVEQVGSTVVVSDLRSTNGTVVTLPGRHPVTLRQGESTVALAGTIVDVGDGNLLEVLPPPRPAAQEGRRP